MVRIYINDTLKSVALWGSTCFDCEVYYTYQINKKSYRLYYNNSQYRSCFGTLTGRLPKDTKLTGNVRIVFKHYKNTTDFINSATIGHSDQGTFLSRALSTRLFQLLKQTLKKYVNHDSYLDDHRKIINDGHTDFTVLDRAILITFSDITRHELFFVLDMYRRLTTLVNTRSVLAAYTWMKQHPDIDFVQALLLTDFANRICTPYDALIGLIYLYKCNSMTDLLNVQNFTHCECEAKSTGYLNHYGNMLSSQEAPDIPISCMYDKLKRYHITYYHDYNKIEDFQIETALKEDVEQLETYYQFLQRIIAQNKTKTNSK